MRCVLVPFLLLACATAAYAKTEDPLDREVIVKTTSGAELHGRILEFNRSTITMAVEPSMSVVVLKTPEVVRVLYPPAKGAPQASVPEAVGSLVTHPPERERHFGLNLGMAPAVDLDLDYRLFYGFASVSVLMPAVSFGLINAFSVGAGVNLRVNKRLKIELFAYAAPTRFGDTGEPGNPWVVGAGVGIGMHYTFPVGLSFGLRLPVIGYALGGLTFSNAAVSVYYFYLSSAVALPIGSIGYRF